MTGFESSVSAARLRAVDSKCGFPYLAGALYKAQYFSTDRVPTAAVGKNGLVYINPNFWTNLQINSQSFVLIHEIWHILLAHWERGSRLGVPLVVDPDNRYLTMLWNIATDMEINQRDWLLRLCEDSLAESVVTPEKFGFPRGLLAEEYFEKLRHLAKNAEDLAGLLKNKQIDPASLAEGSGASTTQQEWEREKQKIGDSAAGNSVGDANDKLSSAGAAVLEHDSPISDIDRRILIRQVYESAKLAGHLPGNIQRVLDQLANPKVDWRQELRAILPTTMYTASKRGHKIQSFRAMSRRTDWLKVNTPGTVAVLRPGIYDGTLNVGVILDSSGSMSGSPIVQAVAEVRQLLKSQLVARTKLYIVDADLQKASVLWPSQDVPGTIPGGGGTDMTIGFKAIEQDDSFKPDVVILLTDGYTPWGDSKPLGETPMVLVIVNSAADSGSLTNRLPTWRNAPGVKIVEVVT